MKNNKTTRGRPPKLTLKRMLHATEEGWTRRGTAKAYKASYGAVCNACYKYEEEGVSLAKEATGVKNSTREDVLRLLLKQARTGEGSQADIAREVGVTPTRVSQIVQELEGE